MSLAASERASFSRWTRSGGIREAGGGVHWRALVTILEASFSARRSVWMPSDDAVYIIIRGN
jgi:hypothetical protein